MSDQQQPQERTDAPDASAKKPKRQRVPKHAKRHEARALALQVLYESDLTEHGWEAILSRAESDDLLTPELADYARRLVTGVMTNRISIDATIRKAAPAFPIKQLSAMDRNLRRLAIYELTYEPDVPTRVAINEAVELAKRYGGDNSSRFINGVTGTVAEQVRPTGGK
ncbi:MAG: transcription antitermination factor NusB [Thermomicrobiales bacterium]|nr:transcription antitermination factor NusB [Thermomicrobiales bacterium]